MFENNIFRLPLAVKVLLAVSLACCLTSCTTITVDCNVPDLIHAINTANTNPAHSTLELASGCTYTLTAKDNTATSFFGGTTFEYGDNGLPQITTPITINGNNATIIRASGAPDFRFFFITDTGSLTINDLTLENGFADASLPGGGYSRGPGSGGAIYSRSYLEVNNSTLQGNQAGANGGAIFTSGTTTTQINGSTIQDNDAPLGGGVFICSSKGLLSVDNSEISNNSAINLGGGINLQYGAELIINASLIASNHSGRHGGGIFKDKGWDRLPTTITGTTFQDNTADWSGGGVFILRTPLTISDSQFSNNQADEYGGGLGYQNNSTETVLISNTTFDGNSATWDGGAIHFSGELMSISGSTIQNNSAENGAGIHNGPADYTKYVIRADTTLIITSSTVQENIASENGGGAFNEGVMTCGESNFVANESSTLGGGIHNTGEVEVLGCTFDKNKTGEDGGGINSDNIAEIRGSDFTNNTSKRGGGFASIGGDAEISQSTFMNNSASDRGGAIFNFGAIPGSSPMEVENCEIIDNTAPFGGGIASSVGDTKIVESTLSRNIASKDGGGIYNDGLMTLIQSTLSGNEASAFGGGIQNMETIIVQESTFSGNTARRGGGLASDEGDTTLTNNTFSANTATDSGGGLYSSSPGGSIQASHITVAFNNAADGGGVAISGGSLGIKNSIVGMNASGGDCSISAGGFSSIAENINSDGSCPGFTLKDDPLLKVLANYGGPTETHALQSDSPAIDAAPDCTAIGGAAVTIDQRGLSRPGGPVCDLGAYEDETGNPVPSLPYIIFQSTLDCRLEPASSSAAITSFQPNETAEVVGRNINLTWYQVAPDGLEDLCWVWAGGVTFIGDLDTVEIIPSKAPVEEEKPEEEGEEPSPSQPGCTVRKPDGALVCQVPCPPNAVPGDPCTP